MKLLRREVYPLIIFSVCCLALIVNCIFSQSWRGWGGQLLFPDYVEFYTCGTVYRTDPKLLYNLSAVQAQRQALIAPTDAPGVSLCGYPVYMAPFFALLSLLPMHVGLVIWLTASIVAAGIGIVALRELHKVLNKGNLSSGEIMALLSCALLLLSFYSGQFSMFIFMCWMLAACWSFKQRPWRAGLAAGILCAKPQFALPLIIIWFARGEFRSCLGMLLLPAGASILAILCTGLDLHLALVQQHSMVIQHFVLAPLVSGLPHYLIASFPALPVALLPTTPIPRLLGLLFSWLAIDAIVFAFVAWRSRTRGEQDYRRLWAYACLFPAVCTPYLLLYDLIIVAILPVLLPQTIRYLHSCCWYVWLWLFPFVSALVGLPLGGFTPAVTLWQINESARRKQPPLSPG